MKKAYEAPKIAVENFVLNQFIAGSCIVGTRVKNMEQILDELELIDPFTAAIIAAGQFAGMLNCSLNADDDNDTLCYHTQGSPLFTS